MTTSARESTSNQAVDTPLSLNMSRTIRADRRKVFEAWTNPHSMRAWFAPGNMTAPTATNDLRVGGEYRVEMKGSIAVHNGADPSQASDPIMVAHGVYREIVPYERLSYTWTGSWDPSEESLVTVTFKDVQGGTEVILTHEGFHTERSRDTHLGGWESSLGKLTHFLAS